MDKPGASSLTCPPCPCQSATQARHDDLIVTRQARRAYPFMASRRLCHYLVTLFFPILRRRTPTTVYTSTLARYCDPRRRPRTTPRARIRVTSPPRLCKGAAAGRGSNAVGLPSETVGEGNMPFLMSSLDGEKFFTERAICPIRVCLFPSNGCGPVDLSPSDLVPRGLSHGF